MNSTQSAKMVWRRYGWTVAPKGFSYGPSMAATFWPDSFRSLGPFWSKLCGPDITTISEPDFELTDWYGADEYDLDNHMERMRQPHLNQTFEVKKTAPYSRNLTRDTHSSKPAFYHWATDLFIQCFHFSISFIALTKNIIYRHADMRNIAILIELLKNRAVE